MIKLVKCQYCKEKFDKTEGVRNNKGYYHVECLEKYELEKAEKKKIKQQKQSKPKKTEVYNGASEEYKELVAYICELYKIKSPTPLILKQIKDLKNTYNFRYKGMELSLYYFHEILGNPVTGHGVGIIPYIYEQTKDFYALKNEVEYSLEEIDEPIVTTKTIRIKSPESKPTIRKQHIDIATL